MEIKLGLALLTYYTWWLIVLICTLIILYKLVTNQNFSVGIRFGIQSASEHDRDFVFQLLLVRRRNGTANIGGQNASVSATPALPEGEQVDS